MATSIKLAQQTDRLIVRDEHKINSTDLNRLLFSLIVYMFLDIILTPLSEFILFGISMSPEYCLPVRGFSIVAICWNGAWVFCDLVVLVAYKKAMKWSWHRSIVHIIYCWRLYITGIKIQILFRMIELIAIIVIMGVYKNDSDCFAAGTSGEALFISSIILTIALLAVVLSSVLMIYLIQHMRITKETSLLWLRRYFEAEIIVEN